MILLILILKNLKLFTMFSHNKMLKMCQNLCKTNAPSHFSAVVGYKAPIIVTLLLLKRFRKYHYIMCDKAKYYRLLQINE